MIKFKKNGEVFNGETLVGHWRKETDPVYKDGIFRAWKLNELPEQGKTGFPRYMLTNHFKED